MYDQRCPLGRLYDTLGERGFIDLGIPSDATIAFVLASHRPRRHRVEFLNQVELELGHLRVWGQSNELDMALWRRPDNKFKPRFRTSETWTQICDARPKVGWFKSVWFS